MSRLTQFWADTPWGAKLAGGTVIVGLMTAAAVNIYRRREKVERKVFPPNTIVFRCFGPGMHVPSMTPYAIKLETFLRMAKLPYETITSFKSSPKGKFPWIEYNGEAIGDSELCIEFLNKEKEVDLTSNLTLEQKGIGRAFQKMLEENTYWAMALDRWVFNKNGELIKAFKMPWLISRSVRKTISKQAHGQGMGRHTEEEVYQIFRYDMEALSRFLGSKKFLFGDKPCRYDCTVFGFLAEIKWEGFGGRATPILEEFTNLSAYCERMKAEFWPDWDECTKEGQNKNKNK